MRIEHHRSSVCLACLDVRILIALSFSLQVRPESRTFIGDRMPGSGAEDFVASATIQATKPSSAKACCGPSCCTPEA
jgi:hypothetical protein